MTSRDNETLNSSIDDLAALGQYQSNCVFQLALIMARIATEPVSEAYRDEAAQTLLDLIKRKPKRNFVDLLRDPSLAVHFTERGEFINSE